MYIHMAKDIRKTIQKLSKNISEVNKTLDTLLPEIVVREATIFGNSAHVVISREHLNKKIGVIVLGDSPSGQEEEKEL
jgi:putative transposon-encoded protein